MRPSQFRDPLLVVLSTVHDMSEIRDKTGCQVGVARPNHSDMHAFLLPLAPIGLTFVYLLLRRLLHPLQTDIGVFPSWGHAQSSAEVFRPVRAWWLERLLGGPELRVARCQRTSSWKGAA